MKPIFSGLGVGLWVVGGLVALYLFGAVLLYLDTSVLRTHIANDLPFEVRAWIFVAYQPLTRAGILTIILTR